MQIATFCIDFHAHCNILHRFLMRIRRPPLGVCGVKGCCTAVSVVLLYCCTAVLLYMVYCSCCLGATTPGRPRPLHPLHPRYPLHPPLRGCWYLRGQMATICSPCPAPATGLLQGLRCRGYAARAMLHMLQLLHWPHRSACSKCCTGHTDRHAPNVALATQIGMLQLLHWPHRSTCPKCRTGRPAEHAPSAALATRISILDMHCCSTRKRWSAHNAEAF